MPLQEQAELWMALRDRMKGSWKELSVQEKKAGASFFPFSVFPKFRIASTRITPRLHTTLKNITIRFKGPLGSVI